MAECYVILGIPRSGTSKIAARFQNFMPVLLPGERPRITDGYPFGMLEDNMLRGIVERATTLSKRKYYELERSVARRLRKKFSDEENVELLRWFDQRMSHAPDGRFAVKVPSLTRIMRPFYMALKPLADLRFVAVSRPILLCVDSLYRRSGCDRTEAERLAWAHAVQGMNALHLVDCLKFLREQDQPVAEFRNGEDHIAFVDKLLGKA